MIFPNFNEEKKLWKKGYKTVVGVDEAGRGPLAGPVVAACVSFKFEIFNLKSNKNLKFINDSKKLSEAQREKFYEILVNHPDVEWGVGIVSEKIIDKINILEATKLAMRKATANLNSKIQNVDYVLLDGNFKVDFYCATEQRSIIKGDQKVFSIAAASIIAKVTRDRMMQKMHRKYPLYGFDKHKGYPTKAHFAILEKIGPCKIHRKTFQGVVK